jgi:hypothetical protein
VLQIASVKTLWTWILGFYMFFGQSKLLNDFIVVSVIGSTRYIVDCMSVLVSIRQQLLWLFLSAIVFLNNGHSLVSCAVLPPNLHSEVGRVVTELSHVVYALYAYLIFLYFLVMCTHTSYGMSFKLAITTPFIHIRESFRCCQERELLWNVTSRTCIVYMFNKYIRMW